MGEFRETVYKKDTKNKIRFLTISTKKGELIQTSGLIDGNPVEHRKMAKPKNVGKANETTTEYQAVLEAESKLKKKLDEGYFFTVLEAENEVVVLPMLAHEYGKHQKKVKYPFYAQPKLDGMRCLAIVKGGKATLISRKGKELVTLKHIKAELEKLPSDISIILDGEVYAHGDDFQRNMELVKKYRKGETELLKFHVYDVIEEKLPFSDRNTLLTGFMGRNVLEYIEYVQSVQIHSEEELKAYHLENVAEGYEGTMIRWGTAGYKMNGRSSNLLKHKDFIDITCPIMDVLPNDANPEHGTPIFEWEGATGGFFSSGTRLTHAMRVDLLKNKEEYIGKTAELRFPEYYNTGVPRFPVMVGIRLDK